ncbi:MAG: exopolysaccharide biosynthesis protein [Coleofasciculus sp. G3-WIS-01]|uniref:exopolysaccharide biosynthesis protein n=1 Tax=Coleofasciculus sp. G3-WIS-01 TaxID=3069528 RepID=UPI0032FDC070
MHLKFTQDIESLLSRLTHQPLTLRDILTETSERGFSLVIGLLVLPFLFPMPPGASSILGLGCLVLSVQMALGRRKPWLPRKVANFRFPPSLSLKLLKNLKRVMRVLEKIVRPRWLKVAESPKIWRWNGFCMTWLSVLLMLPFPFTNPMPTAAILLLVVATLEEDGLLMCVGYGLTALVTLVFAFIAYALWQGSHLLPIFF